MLSLINKSPVLPDGGATAPYCSGASEEESSNIGHRAVTIVTIVTIDTLVTIESQFCML